MVILVRNVNEEPITNMKRTERILSRILLMFFVYINRLDIKEPTYLPDDFDILICYPYF